MRPIEARTFKKICALKRDNLSARDFWLQLDEGTVTLAKQRNGGPAEMMMEIPRAQFDRLVRWYVTGEVFR